MAYEIAEDQTVRYADASGDHFAIHLDDEFARSIGLPGRIVHGLCTLAFTGRAVLEAAGVDDPRAIRRLAARFSAPLFPGDTLTTRVWALGDGIYGFDAAGSDGTVVIKDEERTRVAVTIDLAAIDAIDVHVHAEIGRAGEDGLKPEWRFYPNDRAVYPLYEVVAEAGLPALFHTGHSGIGSGLPGRRRAFA